MRIQGSLLTQCILLLALCTVFSTASHDGDAVERKTLWATSNSKDLYIPGGKSSWCRECTRCDTNSKKSTPACKRACAKCPKNLILEAQQDITLAAPDDINLEAQEDINLEAKKNLILSALEDLTLEAQKDLILQAHEHINLEAKKNLILSALEDLTLEAQKSIILEAQENLDLKAQKSIILEAQEGVDVRIDDTSVVYVESYPVPFGENLYYVGVGGDFYVDGSAYIYGGDGLNVNFLQTDELNTQGATVGSLDISDFASAKGLSVKEGGLSFDGRPAIYKTAPEVLGGASCTCDDTPPDVPKICDGTSAANGGMFLGSVPGTSDYFPVICQCADVAICGWYSFNQICDNIVTNGNGRALENEVGTGYFTITAATEIEDGDIAYYSVYTYIYFQAETTETLSFDWYFERLSSQDTSSYPFYVVTDENPADPDNVIPPETFGALNDTLLCDFVLDEFCEGIAEISVTAGQYYVFGVDAQPTYRPNGAELSVSNLPSCAKDGGVLAAVKTSSKKNKREKKTKRARHTRPPTRKPHTKPSHT